MQLRADQLEAQFARGLKPIYTVHGDDPLLAQEAADAIRGAARAAGYSERKVFVVSGAHFDWSGVLGAAQAMSLFAERQLIEIRIPSGKPGKDGSEALQRYCETLSDDVLTLVHLPRLDRQQQQSGWFTALDAGRPLPLALREARVWGAKERLFERAVPRLTAYQLAHFVAAASVCDGLVKGLRHADWPLDAWDALRRLVLMVMEPLRPDVAGQAAPRPALALRA